MTERQLCPCGCGEDYERIVKEQMRGPAALNRDQAEATIGAPLIVAEQVDLVTDAEIARGRELDRAATQGPWKAETWGFELNSAGEGRVFDPRGNAIADDDGMRGIMTAADAEFIAWARTHLPALLAEVSASRSGPSDDMVESGARADYAADNSEPWENTFEGHREEYRASARRVLRAALGRGLSEPAYEYAIARPASIPDMSGRPRYTPVVNATYPSAERAEEARRRMPRLLSSAPTLIVRRIAPGSGWEAVGGEQT